MLVLSRKVGETIIVGDNIRITVVDIQGRHVRLGFVAPDEVTVDRLEVHEKRQNLLNEWTENVMRPRTLIASFAQTVKSQPESIVSFRHQYQCWFCKSEGVLEFEPEVLQPSSVECHHCGIDNEIPPGLYDRPAVIPGNAPVQIL